MQVRPGHALPATAAAALLDALFVGNAGRPMSSKLHAVPAGNNVGTRDDVGLMCPHGMCGDMEFIRSTVSNPNLQGGTHILEAVPGRVRAAGVAQGGGGGPVAPKPLHQLLWLVGRARLPSILLLLLHVALTSQSAFWLSLCLGPELSCWVGAVHPLGACMTILPRTAQRWHPHGPEATSYAMDGPCLRHEGAMIMEGMTGGARPPWLGRHQQWCAACTARCRCWRRGLRCSSTCLRISASSLVSALSTLCTLSRKHCRIRGKEVRPLNDSAALPAAQSAILLILDRYTCSHPATAPGAAAHSSAAPSCEACDPGASSGDACSAVCSASVRLSAGLTGTCTWQHCLMPCSSLCPSGSVCEQVCGYTLNAGAVQHSS